jgi:glycosyltransferase involved in cell wall biosynthesis
MICILHGYLLEGSGSNLWTRNIVKALCRSGETVQLVCQENHPEDYDFISEAVLHYPESRTETLFRRKVSYPGKCILHKPVLGDTLPVYVKDRYEEFQHVVPMVEMSDPAIEDYLERNVQAVSEVVRKHKVTTMHANHAVLMSVVAWRVFAETGIPYAVMPHGSAIEYAVKPDPRMFQYATEAFSNAAKIFSIGEEMHRRIRDVFVGVKNLRGRLVSMPLGVDTDAFKPIDHEKRPKAVEAFALQVKGRARAKSPEDQLPDDGVERRLAEVDWERDKVIAFVGRLIESKGPQLLVEAFLEILKKVPDARLLVIGHGPLRTELENLASGPGRIVFTGYLPHDLLRYLLPCADVTVFPSVLAEAGPLVFLESLASGCLPLGSNFGGMAAHIDSLHGIVPDVALSTMKLNPDPGAMVKDIAGKVPTALKLAEGCKSLLREAVVERYDWKNVARRLAEELRAMGD